MNLLNFFFNLLFKFFKDSILLLINIYYWCHKKKVKAKKKANQNQESNHQAQEGVNYL